jgi:hypothetical protein
MVYEVSTEENLKINFTGIYSRRDWQPNSKQKCCHKQSLMTETVVFFPVASVKQSLYKTGQTLRAAGV